MVDSEKSQIYFANVINPFFMLLENRPRAIKNDMKKPTCDCRFPKEERIIKKRRPNKGCRCLDTPLLKEFKSQEDRNTDSGREFQSLLVEVKRE